jgi:hypothetical protein
MSYDLEIGTHSKPTAAHVEEWAAREGLTVRSESGEALVVEGSPRGDGFVLTVDGPHRAQVDDFHDELAAACLAPRWMLGVSVPYSAPKQHFALARALARHLAEVNDGAAFDPQDEKLLWPRGRPRRVAPRRAEEPTTRVRLEWFLAPDRWAAAPAILLSLLARHCPEALPTRYGQFEPLQHRFDGDAPDDFVRFLLDNEAGDAFWFASRPSFGGSSFAPHADKYAPADDDPLRIAHLEVSFDGNVLAADERWTAALVDLFIAGAKELGAFFAAGQVETGWMVSTNNRLWAVASAMPEGEHFLRGRLWQGLPPIPIWLSWYGGPYRELVAQSLRHAADAVPADKPATGIRRWLRRQQPFTPVPTIAERAEGFFVRMSNDPLPSSQLPPLGLPSRLIYRHRPRTVDERGAVSTNPAQRDDRAEVIPELATG